MRLTPREEAIRWSQFAKRIMAKRIKRQRKKNAKAKLYTAKPLGEYKRSRILDFCHPRIRGKLLCEIRKKVATIQIPKVFSFIDDPEAAMDVLRSIVHVSRIHSVRNISLDHSLCAKMDMGASICLDILCMEIKKEWQQRGSRKRYFQGMMPKNKKVRDLVQGTGIIKHLKVSGHQIADDDAKKYIYFPLRKGYKPTGSLEKSTSQEQASQDIALYFDKCLKAKNFELTDDGLKHICNLVGEVIDNAEEHSGQRQWFAVGYMDQASEISECHLAIVNFGNTIYESLKQAGTAESLKESIATLSDKHRKKGLFNWSAKWDEENLWTLYALQDGVSRLSQSEEGKDRGTGTVKMIEFFQILGDTATEDKHPQMTLISGMTRILFDHVYRLESHRFGDETRRLITFNDSKSLDDRPSHKHVHSLDGFFPGTILSLRFYIDRSYLNALSGGQENVVA